MYEEVIAKVEDLRVLMLALGPEESLPWHRHSEITETIVCTKGPIQIEIRHHEQVQMLEAGELMSIEPGQSHRVSGVNGKSCKFLLILGVGNWDLILDAK